MTKIAQCVNNKKVKFQLTLLHTDNLLLKSKCFFMSHVIVLIIVTSSSFA